MQGRKDRESEGLSCKVRSRVGRQDSGAFKVKREPTTVCPSKLLGPSCTQKKKKKKKEVLSGIYITYQGL